MSYENEISKMRWSFSRVTTYDQCPYEWYLRYILNDDDEYPEEENYYAQVGGLVHEVLALVYKKKISTEEAVDYFIDHFDQMVTETTKDSVMDTTFNACVDYFSDESNMSKLIDEMKIIGVEQYFSIEMNENTFIGYIDLLLQDSDGELILVDHKSSEYPFKTNGEIKTSARSFEKYKKQLYLYATWVHEKYGKWPKELWWNHFKDKGKIAKIPFDINEYNDAIEWFSERVNTIKNDVDFEAKKEWFYCNKLCAYRNVCEYNEEYE